MLKFKKKGAKKVNDMKGRLIVGVGVLVFAILCIGIFQYYEKYEETFYTQVNNSKVKKREGRGFEDMPYEYTIECYDANGKMKVFKFKTIRELREDAYLALIVRTTGVNSWAEVSYEELPAKVQKIYQKEN